MAPLARNPSSRKPRGHLAAWTLPLLAALAALAGCRGPGSPTPEGLTESGPPRGFRAGTATVAFTPASGYPLGGYGGGQRRAEWPFYLGIGWPGRLALALHQAWHEDDPDGQADLLAPATGVHDELTARAVVLAPDDGPPVALVRLDAIGTSRELHERVVADLADLGYRTETVLLAATHTHSGVGAFLRAPLAALIGTDNFRPEVEASLARACVAAVRSAHAGARPATLALARARDRGADGAPVVGRNRRARRFPGEVARDALDDRIVALRLDDRATGAPLAVVASYAVHPTVLGPDNLCFSADLAGALERALEARVGAPVLFVNGALGDVGPGRVGHSGGLARCRQVGEAFADLVAPAVLDAGPGAPALALRATTARVDLGDAYAFVALGRDRFVEHHRGWASWPTELLTLPVNLVLWALGATNVRVHLTWSGALGAVVHLDGLVGRSETRVGALRLTTAQDDLAWLCVPGEPTHDVGLDLRARAARRGATEAVVAGLSLDHVGYVASEREYRRGGYEAWTTLFGPGTAAALTEALESCLDRLWPPP